MFFCRILLSGANVSSSGDIRVESREAANANEYREYLQSLGVDPDGTAYMGENGSGQMGELTGSTIVNVALAGEHAGKGGAAAGVYVGSVENDIAAEVDSSITAKTLTAQTENKAEIVAATLGYRDIKGRNIIGIDSPVAVAYVFCGNDIFIGGLRRFFVEYAHGILRRKGGDDVAQLARIFLHIYGIACGFGSVIDEKQRRFFRLLYDRLIYAF